MEQIAHNIRALRQNRCFSQEYMALELGIHTSNYNRIESGKHQLSVRRLVEIASILNAEPFELLLDKTWRKRIDLALLNENRLKEIEPELHCLRLLIREKFEQTPTEYNILQLRRHESGAQNYVS
jgi:transcriptional regulator with XRE-family HTH domain